MGQSVTATYVLNVDETDTGYSFVAQVSHDDPGSDVTDIATIDLCANFEAEYGASVSCEVSDDCGDIITFALYDAGDDTTTTASALNTDNTPAPVVSGDSIVISNDQSTQMYYLSFVMDHIDACYNNIDAVQLDMGSGRYVDNDQYYYDNGHKYAFNYVDTRFSDLLPITLRIMFVNGEYLDLENIITDLNGNSVFASSMTCDGAVANTGSPDTTDVIVQTESTAESTSSTTDETTTIVVVELSGTTNVHYRASLCVGSVLLAVLFF